MSIPAMAFNGTFSFCPPSTKKLFQHNGSLEQRSEPLWVEKVESSRRWFGMKMLVAALPISKFFPTMVLAAETTSISISSGVESKNTAMAEAWNSYTGDGFAMKIPPGFEDILGPEEPLDDDSLYGERAKPKPFMARFASADRLAVLSVVVRPASQLKLSFFEVKDVTDLGSPKEAAKVFLPGLCTRRYCTTIKVERRGNNIAISSSFILITLKCSGGYLQVELLWWLFTSGTSHCVQNLYGRRWILDHNFHSHDHRLLNYDSHSSEFRNKELLGLSFVMFPPGNPNIGYGSYWSFLK